MLPVMILILVGFVMPSWSPNAPMRTTFMVLGFSYLLFTYLWWRVTETVLPARGFNPTSLFVWGVFLTELWLWFETLQLALLLLRRTDRTPEADAGEKRLRNTLEVDLPGVDVFIATYNEPLDVLEKTIAGALALDWPTDKLFIHVLDDGQRDWLGDYCRDRGVNHVLRGNNFHAKAGNINAALKRTYAPFILILDADFVPQKPMLMRAMGFFDDPKIGIVQMPHHFFNDTPLQTNMDMRATLPDEQRFFFDVIQPGRDGWDCAFCCGSNGIIRRSAIEEIGGAMPTDSITEDMLLTLALLRRGYVTRYLGERLAIGLAPETLDAYFVQRARWAQGGVQLLYVEHGPFGRGLTMLQRLFFNPSHWLSQSICQPVAMATPAIFLLTGVPPLLNASLAEIFTLQLPAVAAAMMFMNFLAPREFSPIASTVESVLQSFKLMPVVLLTLIKPKGHGFKVTPKGSDAGLASADKFTIRVALALIVATGIGLFLNTNFATRLVSEGELLPVVAFWSVFNMLILLIVITVAVPRPIFRTEERFDLREPCRIWAEHLDVSGETVNVSLSGLLIRLDPSETSTNFRPGDWVGIELAEVGIVPAFVRRQLGDKDIPNLGLSFHISSGVKRDRLIQKLFAMGRETTVPVSDGGNTFLAMIRQVFRQNQSISSRAPVPEPGTIPSWLLHLVEEDSPVQSGPSLSLTASSRMA